MTNASDRELLELIAAQVNNLTSEMQEGFKEVKTEIKDLRESQARIEVEHGEKLAALFDGYKQNSDKLDRHGEILDHHSDILDHHSDILDRLDNRLRGVEKVAASHSDKLDSIDNRLGHVEKESLKHTIQLQRIENKLETHDTQIHMLDKTKANIK